MAEEIKSLEGKNKDLKEMIDYLESPGFLEREARISLDLKKPAEKVVVIKDNDPKDKEAENGINSLFTISGLENEKKEREVGSVKKWRDYFFSPQID